MRTMLSAKLHPNFSFIRRGALNLGRNVWGRNLGRTAGKHKLADAGNLEEEKE